MKRDELREAQRPLKERYGDSPDAALLTLRADGELGSETVSCSVETGRALVEAGLHPASGGDGSLALGEEELEALLETTERYCVVYQTLAGGVPLVVSRSARR